MDLISRQASAEPEHDKPVRLSTVCLRCGKPAVTFRTDDDIPYTNYSYCEDCLRKGLKLLRKLPSADPELINKLDFGINASTGDSAYMVGLRNGLRLAKSYADGSDPQFEKCEEPKTGEWIPDRSGAYCCSKCMEPCATYVMMKPRDKFCKMCGRRNKVEHE